MKRSTMLAVLVAIGAPVAFSLTASAGFDWNFRAPSLSTPTAVDPATPGDIMFDTSSSTFKGYNGASWQEFAPASQPALAIRDVTSTDTATPGDDVLVMSGSSFTETLYSAAGNKGKVISLKHAGTNLTNVYSIAPQAGETIGGLPVLTTYDLYTNGETVKLISDGTNWLVLDHDTNTSFVVSGIPIGATTTTPTKPSATTYDQILVSRDGQYANMVYRYYAATTTGAAAGSGTYLFGLPAGMTMDTTLQPNTAGATTTEISLMSNIGSASISSTTGPANSISYFAAAYSSTQFYISYFRLNSTPTGGSISSSNYPLTQVIAYSISIRVPIAGWQP